MKSNDWIKRLRHESDAFMQGVFNVYAMWEAAWWRRAEKEIARALVPTPPACRKRNPTQEELDEEECRYRRPPRRNVARNTSNASDPSPSRPEGEAGSPTPDTKDRIGGVEDDESSELTEESPSQAFARQWLDDEADRARERIKQRMAQQEQAREAARRAISQKLRLFRYSLDAEDPGSYVVETPEDAAKLGIDRELLQKPGLPDFFNDRSAQTRMVQALAKANAFVSLSSAMADLDGTEWTFWRCTINDNGTNHRPHSSTEDDNLWDAVCFAVAEFVSAC
jgi:hypothetical protein